MTSAYRPTIAVDLDGTLLEHDRWRGLRCWGAPLPGARAFLEQLRTIGQVVIHSCRTTAEVASEEGMTPAEAAHLVEEKLIELGLPFDAVWAGVGKPIAAVYIDDRGVSCRPQEDPGAYDHALALAKAIL